MQLHFVILNSYYVSGHTGLRNPNLSQLDDSFLERRDIVRRRRCFRAATTIRGIQLFKVNPPLGKLFAFVDLFKNVSLEPDSFRLVECWQVWCSAGKDTLRHRTPTLYQESQGVK